MAKRKHVFYQMVPRQHVLNPHTKVYYSSVYLSTVKFEVAKEKMEQCPNCRCPDPVIRKVTFETMPESK